MQNGRPLKQHRSSEAYGKRHLRENFQNSCFRVSEFISSPLSHVIDVSVFAELFQEDSCPMPDAMRNRSRKLGKNCNEEFLTYLKANYPGIWVESEENHEKFRDAKEIRTENPSNIHRPLHQAAQSSNLVLQPSVVHSRPLSSNSSRGFMNHFRSPRL
jgi:hypothetical protein